jgi:hypothetical protein
MSRIPRGAAARPIAFVALLGCLIIAGLHLGFVLLTSPHAIPASQDNFDARQYRELADSVANGEGFQLARGGARGPDLDRTPLYPLFVSCFGRGWGAVPAVLLAQHALVILTAGITALWARRSVRTPWGAGLAFALVGADLTTMTYASYLLTECLFTFCLTLAVALWPLEGEPHPGVRALAAGVAWGLATLTRPITFYLAPLVLIAWILGRRRRAPATRTVLIALLAGGLVVGPWLVRNTMLAGGVVLSTIEGENLLYYRASLVGLPPGKSIDAWRDETRRRLEEGTYDRADPRQSAELDRMRKRAALGILVSHPLGLLRPLMVGLPRLLLSPNRTYLYALLGVSHADWSLETLSVGSLLEALSRREVLYLGASSLYQLVIVVLALIGVVSALRAREAWVIPPLVILVYLSVLSSGLETHARFRVPLVPILAILAVRGLASLLLTGGQDRSGGGHGREESASASAPQPPSLPSRQRHLRARPSASLMDS